MNLKSKHVRIVSSSSAWTGWQAEPKLLPRMEALWAWWWAYSYKHTGVHRHQWDRLFICIHLILCNHIDICLHIDLPRVDRRLHPHFPRRMGRKLLRTGACTHLHSMVHHSIITDVMYSVQFVFPPFFKKHFSLKRLFPLQEPGVNYEASPLTKEEIQVNC